MRWQHRAGITQLVIAQLSDLHCGSPFFDPELLLAHAVDEILELAPDLVVVAGDLTQEGYSAEFLTARGALRPLQERLTTVVVPGNHDAKNVGYVHFQDHFGKGDSGPNCDRVVHLRRAAYPPELVFGGR